MLGEGVPWGAVSYSFPALGDHTSKAGESVLMHQIDEVRGGGLGCLRSGASQGHLHCSAVACLCLISGSFAWGLWMLGMLIIAFSAPPTPSRIPVKADVV